ncbi:hypothetical protein V3C99_004862, partial [Haemonchus contortus]
MMNKQTQDNILSTVQKFLSNAPPSCDVEISVKYNLPKDSSQVPRPSTVKISTATTENVRKPGPEVRRSGSSTFLPRRLRSEERMPLKDAIPILTPERKSESRTRYEPVPSAI